MSRDLTPEDWARISPVLDTLLERPEQEWPDLLRERCGDDAQLRSQVEALLSAHRRASGFLSRPAHGLAFTSISEAGAEADVPPPPERVGPYHPIRELGRGGMGVVYLAERADQQFEQRVALKLVRTGLETGEVLARFRRERQILAGLQHPHIARLLDGGRAQDGRPYFAMEYVEGRPITAYCDERRLGIEERLGLFLKVCGAVQHAHRRLVVHRDLKPSNILVGDDGEPRLLDFGIAKLLTDEGTQPEPTLTHAGFRPLTPDYAAPEQLRGEAVSTATDVYALGLVLCELLTGRHPFRGLRGESAPHEQGGALEATRPSLLAAGRGPATTDEGTDAPGARAAARRTTPDSLRRRLAGDLDTIVLAALRAEPDRRYGSAEALARDIERHLAGLPVSARPDTLTYRARKFVGRHRVGVAAAALVALSLGVGLAASLYQARAKALEARKATEVKDFLVSLFQAAGPGVARGKQPTARELLDRGADQADRAFGEQPEIQAEMLHVVGGLYRELGVFDRAEALLERALGLRRSLHGPDHPDVAATLYHLGLVKNDLGKYEECESLHRQALAIRERRAGGNDPDVVRSLAALAGILDSKGRLGEAEGLQRRAVASARQVFIPTDPELADTISSLAFILISRGEYVEAESLLREAVGIYRSQPGGPPPRVGRPMVSLGLLLQSHGRLEEAEQLDREALAVTRQILGPDHLDVALCLNNLGGVLMDMGRAAEAEQLHREALALRVRAMGPEEFDVANSHHNIAGALLLQGRYDEAEPQSRAALRIAVATMGPEHPAMVAVLGRLAEIQRGRGDPAGADASYRQAIALSRKIFPGGHPRAAEVYVSFGDFLVQRRRATEAEPVLRDALKTFEAKLDADDAKTADARRALGSSLAAQQRYAEAEPLLLEASRVLGGDRYQARRLDATLRALVDLYKMWGKPEQAALYRAKLTTGTDRSGTDASRQP